MIFYGKVIEVQRRQVHRGEDAQPEPEKTFVYMDFPQMPMSRLWFEDKDKEFSPNDELVLRIDVK